MLLAFSRYSRNYAVVHCKDRSLIHMARLTTFREVLAERKTKITPSDPITTTEDFIKYVQPWPINIEKDDKDKTDGEDQPPSKKQRIDHLQDQSGAKKALNSLVSEKHTFSMDKYISVPLVDKKEINKDTRVYTFKHNLNSISSIGLGIGQHILCGFMMNDGIVERPYAITRPTGSDKDDGTFDVLVKTVFPDPDGKNPGGIISNLMDCLSVERKDEMLIRGPEGPITYDGHGNFTITSQEASIDESLKKEQTSGGKEEKRKSSIKVTAKKINFITGGSGMTPIFATIKTILESKEDKHVQVCFLDANKTKDDILLDDELDELRKTHEKQFKLVHILDSPDDGWEGETGKLDKDNISRNVFKPDGDDVVTLVCGPPPMLEAAKDGLLSLGFEEDKTFFHY